MMARVGIVALVLLAVAASAASALPNYRLYTNALGTSLGEVGSYFPHDEFYDASVRDTAREVARIAKPGARVASETPGLFDYYARVAGRSDLVFVSLSDAEAVQALGAGDVVIVARGRRYFSNDAFVSNLTKQSAPVATVSLGEVPSVQIFVLDRAPFEAVGKETRR